MRQPCPQSLQDRQQLDSLLALATRSGLVNLLRRHLLSGLACCGGDGAQSQLYSELLSSVIPDSAAGSLHGSRWLVFPLPVFQGQKGRIIQVLAGLSPASDSLHIAGNLQHDSQLAAKRTIAALATIRPAFWGTVILIPLLGDSEPPIDGESLGLPLALALYLLQTGSAWPEGIYASGCVNNKGQVQPVAGLKKKFETAVRPRCFFVAERDQHKLAESVTVIGCVTLDQALEDLEFMLLSDDPEQVVKLRGYSHNPDHLLLHFHELPLPFCRHPRSSQLLSALREDPGKHLKEAANALETCTYDAARAALLADIFPIEAIERVIAGADTHGLLHAFEWCTARIAHANHIGDTASGADWAGLQQQLALHVTTDELLSSLNHHFVADRFNRYNFSIEIPPTVLELLDQEERRNAACFRPNRQLGAMYGTLCQNFGFCGPLFLDTFDEYANRAEAAFGNRYAGEKQRLLAYRLYVLLDAEDGRGAGLALNRYLHLAETAGPDDWHSALCRSLEEKRQESPYGAALILRTMADLDIRLSATQLDDIGNLLATHLPRHGQHPWQLISLNSARLLIRDDRVEACRAHLRRMAEICCNGGETMQVMALLAYSELHIHGLAGGEQYRRAEELVNDIQLSRHLKQEHFAGLFHHNSTQKMLRHLADNRALFFPFSYR